MDDDIQDDCIVFYRSPVFSKDEVKALVYLVTKHKNIILNKCTNSTTNHAKEEAWFKICKEINKKGFKYRRTVDSLKIKWENLKKEARKLSKNLIDVKCSDLNDILRQIVVLINEADTTTSISEAPQDSGIETVIGMTEEMENNISVMWDDNVNKDSDESTDDEDARERGSRSLNFSPQECSLLLKCAREEKDNIFNKETTGRAIKMKNSAWSRITSSFNKYSPQKRSTKVLRTKFNNMKRLARKVKMKKYFTKNQQKALIDDDSDKKIKDEPCLEYRQDMDTDNDSDNEHEDFQNMDNATTRENEDTPDPLSTVLNGDSGLDSISHFSSCYQFNNKEVIKLKLELLRYQMETAKLERQRIQEALQTEEMERQSKALQTSLRLRAARLNAVAAELKLPPNHPALQYTEQEKHALEYSRKFEHT